MPPSKRKYSDDERKKILNFIIDNEGFDNLRGNMFWKEMEERNVVNRSWQSIKEHFRMKIINNLKHFNISTENKKRILSGYKNTKVVDKTYSQRVRVPKYVDADSGSSISLSNEERITERRCKLTKKSYSEESVSKDNTQPIIEEIKKSKNHESENNRKKSKQLNSIEDYDRIDIVPSSPSISDENSDSPSSCNVNSTNLDENYVPFSIENDKKFLQTITKFNSNSVSCSNIITFIKKYADYCKPCRVEDWTMILNRLIEILNNLDTYDFLSSPTSLNTRKKSSTHENTENSKNLDQPEFDTLSPKTPEKSKNSSIHDTTTPGNKKETPGTSKNSTHENLTSFSAICKSILLKNTEKLVTNDSGDLSNLGETWSRRLSTNEWFEYRTPPNNSSVSSKDEFNFENLRKLSRRYSKAFEGTRTEIENTRTDFELTNTLADSSDVVTANACVKRHKLFEKQSTKRNYSLAFEDSNGAPENSSKLENTPKTPTFPRKRHLTSKNLFNKTKSLENCKPCFVLLEKLSPPALIPRKFYATPDISSPKTPEKSKNSSIHGNTQSTKNLDPPKFDKTVRKISPPIKKKNDEQVETKKTKTVLSEAALVYPVFIQTRGK